MTELKPCPFCGKKAYSLEPDVSNQFWTVSCLSCVAIDITGPTEEQAISKWNTRHYPPEVMQAMERMKPKKTYLGECLTHVCPECMADVGKYYRFCHICGQALDWEE